MVSLYIQRTIGGSAAIAAEGAPSGLDPTRLASWLEIHADNTILVRTGRTETGTGMSAFYAQMVAEELNVRPDTITLVLGDTDKTPDGGYSAGFLMGATNLQKVAAYTFQALLQLSVKDAGRSRLGSHRHRRHRQRRRETNQLRRARPGAAARADHS